MLAAEMFQIVIFIFISLTDYAPPGIIVNFWVFTICAYAKIYVCQKL